MYLLSTTPQNFSNPSYIPIDVGKLEVGLYSWHLVNGVRA
jgi:hypothetical protein